MSKTYFCKFSNGKERKRDTKYRENRVRKATFANTP